MRVIVVGAGVVGLSTAWRLAQRGCRVTVLDQGEVGHTRGSSHGAARITRSTYAHPTWVRLVGLAGREDWPELERAAGRPLRLPGGDAVVWGPEDGDVGAYAVAAQDADVVELDVAAARRRFQGLRFPDAERVLWDRTAAVLAAADAMAALRGACDRLGVDRRAGVRVDGLVDAAGGVGVGVRIGDGRLVGGAPVDAVDVLTADRVVLAVGPWAPGLAGVDAVPVRQSVGYWSLAGASAGRFPCFIHLGGAAEGRAVHYGLPGIGEEVLKAALHRTSAGVGDDPEAPAGEPVGLDAVGERLRSWFADVGPLVRSETCFYTNTPTEDFVLDHHPDWGGRVVVGAGLSGHGFKFGPLLGRILADLVVDGVSAVAPYAADRERFRFRR